MMMVLKQIDLEQDNLSLEQLLAELDANTEILLTRGNVHIAKIAPAKSDIQPTQKRVLGLHEGQGWMSDNFTDELPASFWSGDEE